MKVTRADGTVVENVYDVDGVMVRMRVNGVGTGYLVDTSGGLSHVVAEVDGSSNVTGYYVREGDRLFEVIRRGTARMYATDGLSVRVLLDEAGNTTDTYAFTSFGENMARIGSDPNPYQFATERLVPEVGMYQNRARWLDVGTGRFLSIDPDRTGQRWPAESNPYAYASGNPVTRRDPTGRFDAAVEGVWVLASLSDAPLKMGANRARAPNGTPLQFLDFYTVDTGTDVSPAGYCRYWSIKWMLKPSPSGHGGHIVQHVVWDFLSWTDSNGNAVTHPADGPDNDYSEAWPVLPGAKNSWLA